MPAPLSQGNCQYLPIAAAGTTTVNPTPPAGGSGPSQPQVFYGAQVVAVGTSFVITALDVYVAGTSTVTSTLMQGTAATQNQQFVAGLPGVGVRFRGQLLLVVTGTPGQFNALWD